MTLEKSIDRLSEALEAHTLAVNNAVEKGIVIRTDAGPDATDETSAPAEKPAKKPAAKPAKKPVKDETPDEEAEDEDDGLGSDDDDDGLGGDEITHDSVKQLGIDKIAEGIPRAQIKGYIVKLGGKSITDLSQDKLEKLHKKLLEI